MLDMSTAVESSATTNEQDDEKLFPLDRLPNHHLEAYINQSNLYSKICTLTRSTREKLNLLDFGCGKNGVSRAILDRQLTPDDSLYLFDRVQLKQTEKPNRFIAEESDIFGQNRIPFDIVSLSYVLCMHEPQEAHELLCKLRKQQPNAHIIVVDYILKGRSKIETLMTLTSNEELKWITALGENEFFRTHTRFNLLTLYQLIRNAGYKLLQLPAYIDNNHVRGSLVAQAPTT